MGGGEENPADCIKFSYKAQHPWLELTKAISQI